MSRSAADVGGPTHRAAPKLGEDNEFVFGELVGLSKAEIASLTEEGVL
jgi:crotonobetainyl-CoA:carnitine CoA-transferase CaiB-like acyl-CoA transferase